MPPDFGSLLPLASIVITLCAVIGGALAFRGSQGRGASEIQERAIDALQAQTEAQEKQIKMLEK